MKTTGRKWSERPFARQQGHVGEPEGDITAARGDVAATGNTTLDQSAGETGHASATSAVSDYDAWRTEIEGAAGTGSSNARPASTSTRSGGSSPQGDDSASSNKSPKKGGHK